MKPYAMMSCAEIREILQLRASGEQELLEIIEDVEPASIHYHMHSYYLRGKYHCDRYPNDFATWIAENVRDRVLSERLSILDPRSACGTEALRGEIVSIMEEHLRMLGFSPRALFGDPFEFMKAHVVSFPVGPEVRTIDELRHAIRHATHESLYWHFFEDACAKTPSLLTWLAEEAGDRKRTEAVARVNPYRIHLEHLRAEVLRALE